MNVIRDARTRIELLATALAADGLPQEYLTTLCHRLVGDLGDLREWFRNARREDQNRGLEDRLEALATEFVRSPIRASVGALDANNLSSLLNLAEDFLGDAANWIETACPAPTGQVVQFRRARPAFITAVITGGAA